MTVSGLSLSRAQEEVASVKRKLERYKSKEWASASDEVLLEEIRTYKVRVERAYAHALTHTHTQSCAHTVSIVLLSIGQTELSMLQYKEEGHCSH